MDVHEHGEFVDRVTDRAEQIKILGKKRLIQEYSDKRLCYSSKLVHLLAFRLALAEHCIESQMEPAEFQIHAKELNVTL